MVEESKEIDLSEIIERQLPREQAGKHNAAALFWSVEARFDCDQCANVLNRVEDHVDHGRLCELGHDVLPRALVLREQSRVLFVEFDPEGRASRVLRGFRSQETLPD